ncbi:MAG: phosphoribosyltransferase family protein [Bacteroidota bacterium]
MSTSSEIILMSQNRILRSLNRMGHEIAEQNVKDLPIDLFGINQRGYAVAKALADVLGSLMDSKVRVFQLLINEDGAKVAAEVGSDEANKHLPVVVDDVIFSGSTMFKALNMVVEMLDLSEVHTATLIDRGHRKFPVKAEFYGMELPTKLNEHVSVVVEEQRLQKVVLTKL